MGDDSARYSIPEMTPDPTRPSALATKLARPVLVVGAAGAILGVAELVRGGATDVASIAFAVALLGVAWGAHALRF
ncbi:MAG: hypothetical protein AB7S26_24500 [Sandaracinaceae bacterium]